MSLRNKKLTALQSITHSLENSIEKATRAHNYRSQQKKQIQSIEKANPNPYVKRFQVRKLIQNGETATIEGKIRFKSLRMHTQKLVNSPIKKNQSPYQRSQTVSVRQTQQQQKYPFLTKFQRQEIGRYEVHYIGSRRIHSIKDFTNSSCEARVSVGDAVAYRYQIISSLGQGSFGQVFKAYDHKKHQMVALKIIRNEPKFSRQAKVQIKILENVLINDPKMKANIVQLKHGFFFRGHACLVFQLLHINLYQFLRKFKFNGLNLDLIRRIAIQILQGLLFLSKQNIIHCDLKPQNILLKQQNKTGVKIIDVGSGCYESQQIYTYIQSRFYRAPQIILGITYTPAIDMWSMGCILCELLLGYPIFPGQNQPEQILMFMEVLGVPSSNLIQRGSRSNKFFQGNLVKIKPNSKGKIRRPNSKSLDKILQTCEDPQFILFVKQFLIWDPQARINAHDALLQPWIMKGLPEQVRKQHINSVKRESYY